ncbi:MAG: ACP S-malonyltransferase [Kiritimatiellaeota bacterium]|nr:ACP S-malonyltransferase [Kiritimatiellota bacterium]
MNKRIGFMFAGQGAQFVGMGKDLAEVSSAAREVFADADRTLGRSISDLCFEGPAEKLTESRNCQPAIYTVSLAALAALRDKFSVQPVIAGGLSLGEFAALTAAGVLDFETGIRLVAARGELMQEACRNADGAMAAVLNADPALVAEVAARHDVDVANENCPGQIVISGVRERVRAAVTALHEAGVQRVVPLKVDGAFHSRLMQPAADRFRSALADVSLRPPTCPVVQNIEGGLVRDPERIRDNLAAQVTGTVHWEQCVRAMIASGVDGLIEIGPGRVLSGFMRRIDRSVPVWCLGTAADLDKVVQALTA